MNIVLRGWGPIKNRRHSEFSEESPDNRTMLICWRFLATLGKTSFFDGKSQPTQRSHSSLRSGLRA